MSSKTVYIVLFRGVGGKTQLPVQPLREALSDAGFEKVATYINSGNALVQSALPRHDVLSQIADVCESQFGFRKEIFALTSTQWAELIENNPFPQALATPTYLHAAVLADEPDGEKLEKLMSYAVEGENVSVVNRVAYLYTPHGFGTSKLAAKFDKSIGVSNTARNWNSVLKLMQLANSMNT